MAERELSCCPVSPASLCATAAIASASDFARTRHRGQLIAVASNRPILDCAASGVNSVAAASASDVAKWLSSAGYPEQVPCGDAIDSYCHVCRLQNPPCSA